MCPKAVVGPGNGRGNPLPVSPLRTAAMPLAGVALQSLASSVVGGVRRFQLADTGLLSQNLHRPMMGQDKRGTVLSSTLAPRTTTISLSIAQVGGWSSSGATARGIIHPPVRSSYRWKT